MHRCRPAARSISPTAPAGWASTRSTCWRSRSNSRRNDPAYEDIASKFFEHFLYIADAMNKIGDAARAVGRRGRLLLRLSALPDGEPDPAARPLGGRPDPAVRGRNRRRRRCLESLPDFAKRVEWFIDNRPDLRENVARHRRSGRIARAPHAGDRRPRASCAAFSQRMLDESEFLSPLRDPLALALSQGPSVRLDVDGSKLQRRLRTGRIASGHVRRQLELARAGLVSDQLPADRSAAAAFTTTRRRSFKVEFPTGSGNMLTLWEVAARALAPADRHLRARRRRAAAGLRRHRDVSDATRTGAITSCSTNTSTATTARGSARATRPAGPALVAKLIQQRAEYCGPETSTRSTPRNRMVDAIELQGTMSTSDARSARSRRTRSARMAGDQRHRRIRVAERSPGC